ncbi:MAG: major Facilitator Superfamily protein [Candidatus Xenolissoclinum pacificiensis L6]|uniref:Major Facilitator Superfamily protein n=1 Tax=Candidatus Xenolissoclinum pacificiensis L6 TaxID=1401685 RepID=W2UZK2_9RICK|nr:MAG: major Facilitator Superfamily protein [Candidatus Xenolissoclinum pacificiensis L6]
MYKQKSLWWVVIPVLCSGLVWFNYYAYVNSSSVFSRLFFKSFPEPIRVVSVLFVFSYIMQLLGAVIIGYIGDKRGRIIAINISGSFMCVGTIIMGLVSNIVSIFASQVMLMLAIALQGFGLGGIKVGFDLVIGESYAKSHNIVRVTSFNMMLTEMFIMFNSIIGFALAHCLTWEQFSLFGWRIPFLLGGLLLAILILSFNLVHKDELHVQQLYGSGNMSLWRSLVLYREVVLFLFLIDMNIFSTYFLVSSFLPHILYAIGIIEFKYTYVLTLSTNTIFLGAIMMSSYIADKFRLRMAIFNFGMIVICTTTIPLFKVVEQTDSIVKIISLFAFTGFIVGAYFAPITTIAIELITDQWHRYKIMSFAFSLSGLMTACLPMVALGLYNKFHKFSVIGFMMSISNLACLLICNVLFWKIKQSHKKG